ncbi:MAG: hypothetical protein K9K34_09810 [Desulfarculaceae bacterium]|nr:hypothetical protein [Desulfarculaceae bacterium]
MPALTSRLRLLLAVWCARQPQGSSGLEFSLPDLERLSLAQQERCGQLAAQARQSKQSLARAARLGAPPKVHAQLSRLLKKNLNHLAQAKQEAGVLEQAVRIYGLLLRQAPAWLGQGGKPEAPSPEEALGQAQEALDQIRHTGERCRRLADAHRLLERREAALATGAQAVLDRAAKLRPMIDALARRLEALAGRPEPLPPDLGAPPELARLQRDLEQAHGRAAALDLDWKPLRQRGAQRQKSRELVRCAWEQANRRAGDAEQDLTRARKQALAAALGLGRAAVAAGRAATEMEKMLGSLRPRELAGQIAACRARAKACSTLAAGARERLTGLQRAHSRLPSLEIPPLAPPMAATSAGPLPELERLEQLMERARELYQAQVAQALADERQANQRQAREASERLEKAAQGRKQLRRKLAQRQEQARRTLAEMQQSRHEAQDRQEQLEKARAELESGKRLALKWREELGQAQAEAESWRRVAAGLRRENAQALQESRAQRRALQKDADALQARVEELQEQMRSLALLTTVAARPAEPSPRKVESALLHLAAARRRLAQAGKKVAVHAALILGLGSALVLASPNLPATATLRDHTRAMATLQLRAEVLAQVPATELKVSLVPLGQPLMPLGLLDDQQFTGLAARAGLSPYALYRSIRAAHPDSVALELAGVERLARQSQALAQRHPLIFSDLAGRSLPPGFSQLLDPAPAPQAALHRFTDRLYRDYRRLGYGPAQALAAVLTNQQAAGQWVSSNRLPSSYLGRVRPVRAVEKMGLSEFLARLTPYIAERSRRYLTSLGKRPPANLERYSRDLAFDMYGAAKRFQVPLSYLLAIAHQETFYANVLGDDNLSASPFQIWRPTLPHILRSMAAAGFAPPPIRIRLQNHLTLATYLAAFHLRELMLEASAPATKRHRAYVDMDKVMLRYNGSHLYAGRVAVRRAELSRFIAVGGS